MEAHAIPNEPAFAREDDAAEELIAELQGKVKAAGL